MGNANFIGSPQIAKPQILGLILLSQICKYQALSSTFPSGFHPDTLQRACSAFFHLSKRFLSRYSAACLRCLLPPSQAVFIQILCSMPAVLSSTFPSGSSSRYSAACLRCLLPPSQTVFIQILCSVPAVPSSTFPSGFYPDFLQHACSAFIHLTKWFLSRYSAACLRCLLPPSQVVFIQILCSAFFHLPKWFSSRYSAACLQCILPPSQVVFNQILCSVPAVPSSTFPSGFHQNTLQHACGAFFHLPKRFHQNTLQHACGAFFHLPKRFSSRYSAACLCSNF